MSVDFFARAEQTWQAMNQRFRAAGTGLYYERVQRLPTDRNFSELWPYSGVVSAANALAAHSQCGERYYAALRQALAGLEVYYDAAARPAAYDSYLLDEGGAQKYYDDNEWLGIEFIRAYRTLQEPADLDRARAMFDFALSGWSEAMGGGIYWRENDPETKNTCSNGPAAVLALLLYEETAEKSYLEAAQRILAWNQALLSAQTGVYLDAVKADGSVDERTFTYNTGTPLHASALLYRITGAEEYLQQARALAAAALRHFGRLDLHSGERILPNTPWFNAVLLRGCLELYRVDPDHDPTYVHFFQANLNYAWEHARAADGSFTPDWSGQTELDSPVRWLLDQAAMVELFALVAEIA